MLGMATQEKDVWHVIRTLTSSTTWLVRMDTQQLPARGITGGWTAALSTAMPSAFPQQVQPKESTFMSPLQLPAR